MLFSHALATDSTGTSSNPTALTFTVGIAIGMAIAAVAILVLITVMIIIMKAAQRMVERRKRQNESNTRRHVCIDLIHVATTAYTAKTDLLI